MSKSTIIDVRKIVQQYLLEHGYDGLYATHDWCACEADDLMPCDYDCGTIGNCEPGYKVPCVDGECEMGGGCNWHISGEEPDVDGGN